jgi:hypothetical protein
MRGIAPLRRARKVFAVSRSIAQTTAARTRWAQRWADDLRLSDIERHFTCSACGKRGADVRPDFNSNAIGSRDQDEPFRAS